MLYRTESRRFDRRDIGRIVVKVINDDGGEVMKGVELGYGAWSSWLTNSCTVQQRGISGRHFLLTEGRAR